jgi:hypothetical protein
VRSLQSFHCNPRLQPHHPDRGLQRMDPTPCERLPQDVSILSLPGTEVNRTATKPQSIGTHGPNALDSVQWSVEVGSAIVDL